MEYFNGLLSPIREGAYAFLDYSSILVGLDY